MKILTELDVRRFVLTAWEDRWTASAFVNCLQRVWQVSDSVQIPHLAEILITLGVQSRSPNKMLFQYLEAVISYRLVSFVIVLECICKYEKYRNIECIAALSEILELALEEFCLQTEEDEQKVGEVMTKVMLWILRNVEECFGNSKRLRDYDQLLYNQELLGRFYVCLKTFTDIDFLLKTFDVVASGYPEMKKEIFEKFLQLQPKIFETSKETEEALKNFLYFDANHMPILSARGPEVEPKLRLHCLQPILAISVVNQPGFNKYDYAAELRAVQSLFTISTKELLYELFWATMISMTDTDNPKILGRWCSFAYYIVPNVARQLAPAKRDADHSVDTVKALEVLVRDSFIKDYYFSGSASMVYGKFVSQLMLAKLINAEHFRRFVSVSTVENLLSEPILKRIYPIAEKVFSYNKTVIEYLRVLSKDFKTHHTQIFRTLDEILKDNNLDMVLSVMLDKGLMKKFAKILIRLNEEAYKTPTTDKLFEHYLDVFDITFLILMLICQEYKESNVTGCGANPHVFFLTWLRISNSQSSYPESLELLCLSDKVLESFHEMQTWFLSEIHSKIQAFVYHLVVSLLKDIDKSKMLKKAWLKVTEKLRFYNIISTTLLCRLIQQPTSKPPLRFEYKEAVESLLRSTVNEDTNQKDRESTKTKRNYKELTALSQRLIKRIVGEVQLSEAEEDLPELQDKATEEMKQIWQDLKKMGHLSLKSAESWHLYVKHGDLRQFTEFIVEQMMKERYAGDMRKDLNCLFGIFHFDLLHVTGILVEQILPEMFNRLDFDETRSFHLALLTIKCLLKCVDDRNEKVFERPKPDIALEYPKHSKIPRIHTEEASSADEDTPIENFSNGDVSEALNCRPFDELDSIFASFFALLDQNLNSDYLTLKVLFVFQCFEIFLQYKTKLDLTVSKFLTENMVKNFLKFLVNDEMKMRSIEAFYDWSSWTVKFQVIRNHLFLLRPMKDEFF